MCPQPLRARQASGNARDAQAHDERHASLEVWGPVAGQRLPTDRWIGAEEGVEDWELVEGESDGRRRRAERKDQAQVGWLRLERCHCSCVYLLRYLECVD